MYLNTVMLSLLLGTAFMTVQLTTAQIHQNITTIQVNVYSDNNCKDYLTYFNATTSSACDSASPSPLPQKGSIMAVCPPDNCHTSLVIYPDDSCPLSRALALPCQCPTYSGGVSPPGYICESAESASEFWARGNNVGPNAEDQGWANIHFNVTLSSQ